MAYVERNPLRAKIVRRAEDYLWSSAVAHVTGGDGSGLLDMDWQRTAERKKKKLARVYQPSTPERQSNRGMRPEPRAARWTFAGRLLGDEHFVDTMALTFDGQWRRREGRPSKGRSRGKRACRNSGYSNGRRPMKTLARQEGTFLFQPSGQLF